MTIDAALSPAPKRIAYGGGIIAPVMDINSSAMACNRFPRPAPGDVAEVRAGGDVTFYWSNWLHSHRGPVSAWMAPYDGDVAAVDVGRLEFVKFAEETLGADGVWATDRMMARGNLSWTATIPADIKPGNYIVRQEVSGRGTALVGGRKRFRLLTRRRSWRCISRCARRPVSTCSPSGRSGT